MMRALGRSLAVALLVASCASSESGSSGPQKPFSFGNDLTEWVTEEEVHDLLEELVDDYGGEVADDYHAVAEQAAETDQQAYFFNPSEDPDADVDVDADILWMEVRTGNTEPARELSDRYSLWPGSDRLPEGAGFLPMAWYGYAFHGPDSDEYVEVYVWRDWNPSHAESGEYEAVHLTAGAMVLKEMNWAD